jgi:hypothetical protein
MANNWAIFNCDATICYMLYIFWNTQYHLPHILILFLQWHIVWQSSVECIHYSVIFRSMIPNVWQLLPVVLRYKSSILESLQLQSISEYLLQSSIIFWIIQYNCKSFSLVINTLLDFADWMANLLSFNNYSVAQATHSLQHTQDLNQWYNLIS